jgi:hypothetical protein
LKIEEVVDTQSKDDKHHTPAMPFYPCSLEEEKRMALASDKTEIHTVLKGYA